MSTIEFVTITLRSDIFVNPRMKCYVYVVSYKIIILFAADCYQQRTILIYSIPNGFLSIKF